MRNSKRSLEDGLATTAEADPALSGASWIPVIQPHLSPVLVGPEQLERVRSVAQYLPGDALYALEVRLASESRQVDLSVRINRPAEAHRIAACMAPGHRREFLKLWGLQTHSASLIPELWLEFDLAGPGKRRIPEPVLCVRVPRRLDIEWLLRDVLPQLHGRYLSTSFNNRIRRCLASLTPGVRLLYVFDLSARGRRAIRLEVYGQDLSNLETYLKTCVSSRALKQISVLQTLLSTEGRYHLSIDLDEAGFYERIGIENSYQRLPHREPRWGSFFDRLVTANLCSASERGAIFAWPGNDSPPSSRCWPAEAKGHCVRCLSHIKLSTWPDKPPKSKAYLLYQYLPRA